MVNRFRGARTLGLIGVVFVFLFAVASASAQTAPPSTANGRGQRRPLARLMTTPYRPIVMELRGLKLTPGQRQQIMGIFKAHQPELKAVADKLRAARQGWQQAGKIDIQERQALNEQRMAVLKAVRTEILGTLSPEQQKQLQTRRQRALKRLQ